MSTCFKQRTLGKVDEVAQHEGILKELNIHEDRLREGIRDLSRCSKNYIGRQISLL